MTNKHLKSDLSVKINKNSCGNITFHNLNSSQHYSDRGDSGTQSEKPDGLYDINTVYKNIEQRKTIDQFIRQYLPDRGDSKRLVSNLGKSNKITNDLKYKTRKATMIDYDIGKSSYKVQEKVSNGDYLIIPETGEKVCKTDVKLSYFKPVTNCAKINNILKTATNFRNKINNQSNNKFGKKNAQNTLNPKLIENYKFSKDNSSETKNKSRNDKEIHYTKNNTDELPISSTSKLIEQILRQSDFNMDFKERNHQLNSKNPYVILNKENKLLKNVLKEPNFERDRRQCFRDSNLIVKERNRIMTKTTELKTSCEGNEESYKIKKIKNIKNSGNFSTTTH